MFLVYVFSISLCITSEVPYHLDHEDPRLNEVESSRHRDL